VKDSFPRFDGENTQFQTLLYLPAMTFQRPTTRTSGLGSAVVGQELTRRGLAYRTIHGFSLLGGKTDRHSNELRRPPRRCLLEVEKDIPRPQDPQVLVIDINSGVKKVIEGINQCKVVLSASLHGVITAEAYGIPAIWIRATNRLSGGSWKFDDYYLSTDREPVAPVRWKADSNPFTVADGATTPPELDGEPLIQALAPLRKPR